jgi:hypothetical protein
MDSSEGYLAHTLSPLVSASSIARETTAILSAAVIGYAVHFLGYAGVALALGVGSNVYHSQDKSELQGRTGQAMRSFSVMRWYGIIESLSYLLRTRTHRSPCHAGSA